MADNLNERGPQDRSRINVHEDHEVKYCAHVGQSGQLNRSIVDTWVGLS